jgi:hypothetical protein
MVASRVGVPKEIIDDVRDVLDRPVVRRIRIEKQMMAKRFQDKKRTFYERVSGGEVAVIPNELALKRGNMRDDTDEG